jgi:hypothetical protein
MTYRNGSILIYVASGVLVLVNWNLYLQQSQLATDHTDPTPTGIFWVLFGLPLVFILLTSLLSAALRRQPLPSRVRRLRLLATVIGLLSTGLAFA